jgi:hypothetical protein
MTLNIIAKYELKEIARGQFREQDPHGQKDSAGMGKKV